MPTVTISVDCEAANAGRCYTRELVKVAQEFTVPLTWLIYISEKDPLSNLDLYRNEYFHRIPAWHELGLLVKFEDSNGYISDPQKRGDLLRIAKDTIKSRHIKPTSFRAHDYDLLPDDLPALEDLGILVDGSMCPGATDKTGVRHPNGEDQPYRPSAKALNDKGDCSILLVPVTSKDGVCACLDQGWEKTRPVVEDALANKQVLHMTLTDTVDGVQALRSALAACRQAGAQVVTMTQLASMQSQ
jgi:hypothetical protein